MNLSLIIAYGLLFFEIMYIIIFGGENMTGDIISAVIAAVTAIIVALIGNVISFVKGRHHEENEHNNLSKEHDNLESLIKENRQELRHLSDESIRMESLREKVKEQGVDLGRVVADIQLITQMNGELSKKNTSLTEEIGVLKKENYSLREDREWMREQIQNLQEQLKEKEQTIRELQQPQRDEPDWDLGR